MNQLNKRREYQNKQVEEDLYQFEMGNELGAQLEKNKDMHEDEYQKQSVQEHMNHFVDKNANPYKNNQK